MAEIVIRTFADMLDQHMAILAHCIRCRRCVQIDIAAIVAAGRGHESSIGRTWRCSRCGEVGQVTSYSGQNRLRNGTIVSLVPKGYQVVDVIKLSVRRP